MADTSEAVKSRTPEIAARRAVAGVDAEIREAGASAAEADAITVALRHYLVGDLARAREALRVVYENGMIERILAEFDRGSAAA